MSEPLKLRAEDAEDIRVLSSCLQDALVRVADMKFLSDENRFVLVANRFRWENCEDGVEPCEAYERVNCGLCFEKVSAVRVRNVDRRCRERILELLAIDVGDRALTLIFAGDAAIRLEVEEILCHLKDLGEPWPTIWRPNHPLEADA